MKTNDLRKNLNLVESFLGKQKVNEASDMYDYDILEKVSLFSKVKKDFINTINKANSEIDKIEFDGLIDEILSEIKDSELITDEEKSFVLKSIKNMAEKRLEILAKNIYNMRSKINREFYL